MRPPAPDPTDEREQETEPQNQVNPDSGDAAKPCRMPPGDYSHCACSRLYSPLRSKRFGQGLGGRTVCRSACTPGAPNRHACRDACYAATSASSINAQRPKGSSVTNLSSPSRICSRANRTLSEGAPKSVANFWDVVGPLCFRHSIIRIRSASNSKELMARRIVPCNEPSFRRQHKASWSICNHVF